MANDKDNPKNSASIPSSRLGRLARLGSLATSVAGGMLAEGARQLAQGNRPNMSSMLLTPANAKRVADELSRLRGAAMKVGQLISMDAGELLPPELTEILGQLRSDAKPMPLGQLAQVLEANWGKDWNQRFSQFSFQPIAAASIGQVHSAYTQDGEHLALKIQYPNIRASINSDVDNVATLLRVSGLIPKDIDFRPLLEEAKAQLHQEADYLREAAYMRRYQTLLGNTPHFKLAQVNETLTTDTILAMSFVEGVPIESLVHAPQAERDQVFTLLMQLFFRELFEFHLVQTDPNYANYRYDRQTQQIILLDFGAARDYSPTMSEHYRHLIQAAIAQNEPAIIQAAQAIGYFQDQIEPAQLKAVSTIFQQAVEPLRHQGVYDFANSNLATRVRETGVDMTFQKGYWHTPPADAIFLHRKLGGLYLLASKLKVKVDMGKLFDPYK
jgi:predicted unusual protein kinase regulating ubiquinone biosynthesis (AarF/ABC1/UbiB family)